MKKITLLLVLSALFSSTIMAQTEEVPAIGVLRGMVTDAENGAVAFASVSLLDAEEKLILGTITEEDGSFLLEEIPLQTLTLQISFIGYTDLRKELNFSKKQKKINLESLTLETDAKQLEEVVVTAEKSEYNLRLDKKVFNVGKDALSQGGSALDILEQVPLVAVEPGGAVTLRGSSAVQILINGRRSGLTLNNALEQIPSDNIEKVEVITNPSARFSAEGSAGIINIVLKKNVGEGWNGQVRATVGTPADYAVQPGINYRGKKFNFFSNLRWRYSDYVGRYFTTQRTSFGGVQESLYQFEDEDRHDDGRSGYFGADYNIDKNNSLTVAFYRAETKDTDLTLLNYETEDAAGKNSFVRTGNSVENRNYNQLEGNYTKTTARKGEKLTVDFQYDFWNSNKDWDLATRGDFIPAAAARDLRTNNKAGSRDFVLQTDYVRPLKSGKIELGGKIENRIVTNAYLAEVLNDSDWMVYQGIDNDVEYKERIGAAYLQYGGEKGKFEYMFGLRTEYTSIDINDVNNEFTDSNDYLNLFPTANFAYTLNEKNSMQLSYSRRINRPSLWNLYPFFEITDYNVQQTGNPNLQPAFADALELSYLFRGEKLTLNPNIYYSNVDNAFQDFLERDEREVFLYKPINIDQREELGFEVSARYSPARWLRLDGEVSWFSFEEKGQFEGLDLAAEGTSWRMRAGANLRLPKDFSLQARFNYWGSESLAQSRSLPAYVLSFGASKDFFDDKLNVSVRAYNVLDSRWRHSISEAEDFFLERRGSRNQERLSMSFLYRFNQTERDRMRRANRGNR